MVRFTVDNRNRLIFYGNPVGYVKADTAVVDEMFRTDELNQYLSRMHDFFSTALTSSGIRLSCWQQPNYSIT